MLDSDLAELYQVETRVLNQAVKRNIERFPDKFRFQLAEDDFLNLKSQTVISSSEHGGRRKLPFVFTEQGVSMLSSVLRSETAIKVSILIIDAFVEMRRFLFENANLFNRLDNIEKKQLNYQIKSNKKFEQIFKAIEDKSIKPKQGIFYDGQIFDAYVFVAGLIKSAKNSILLIDNYVDESVLQLFTKRSKNVHATIYTKKISRQLTLDLKKHNEQYPSIEIKEFTKAHDRFLIIDQKELYHFGASLKDLGKKWFAFSKMDMEALDLIANLKKVNSNE